MMTLPRMAVALLLLATALTACGEGEPVGQEDPFTSALVRLDDALAAEVNGTPIYVSDVRRTGQEMGLVGPLEPLEPSSDRFAHVLDWLIQRRLLALEARRQGLDQGAEARRRMAAAREAILYDLLVEQAEAAGVAEDALRKLYEERLRFGPGEEVRARLIVVRALEEARAIAALAREPQADFAQLALERSIHGATRFEGGDLGYFGRGDLPLREIEDAAFATDVGAVSDPFRSRFGWQVVKVEDRRARRRQSFEELRPQLAEWLRQEARAQLMADLTDASRARIVRHVGAGTVADDAAEPGAAGAGP